MRIWYQSAVEMAAEGGYRSALQAHFDRVVDPATEVVLAGVDTGTWAGQQPSDLFGYPAIFQAALGGAFLRNARRAEREGFDAFIIGTYIEPYLRELRAAVDIPVVSSLETMLLVGCSTAHTLALITLNQALLWSIKISIERHRLGARVGPLLVMEPALTERELTSLFDAPQAYLGRFIETGRRAVAAHADAIIPAEGILAEIVTANGITEIDGATVMDGIAIPVAYAEMLVKLRRKTGLAPGRHWHHKRPPPELLDQFLARLG